MLFYIIGLRPMLARSAVGSGVDKVDRRELAWRAKRSQLRVHGGQLEARRHKYRCGMGTRPRGRGAELTLRLAALIRFLCWSCSLTRCAAAHPAAQPASHFEPVAQTNAERRELIKRVRIKY